MKELSIEEKAKAYDEALARANEMIKDMTNICGVAKVDDIQHIFPELRETEDERIRKDIMNFLRKGIDVSTFEDVKEKYRTWISWIQKDGEHANFINEIQIGDKVTRNKDGVLVNLSQLNRVAKKYEKQGEQKSTDKVEPKFHEGDIIIHKELGGYYIHSPHKIIQVDILDKKYRLEGGLVAHFGEQEDYELVEHNPTNWLQELEDKLVNATPKQLAEWKEKYFKEEPAEWSEQDERIYNSITYSFAHNYPLTVQQQEFVKSLKERYTWKPSYEQLEALVPATENCAYSEYQDCFRELIGQLKKLMGNSYESK